MVDMDDDTAKAVGSELARRMLDSVRTSARKDHHEKLVKRLKGMRALIHPDLHPGYNRAIEYLQQELDNELNWRTL